MKDPTKVLKEALETLKDAKDMGERHAKMLHMHRLAFELAVQSGDKEGMEEARMKIHEVLDVSLDHVVTMVRKTKDLEARMG